MLSEHPDVVTHKYADFLMPYMPCVWNKVFPRIPVDAMRKPVPRIHRDRIEVTRDSAEMGEEILWEHFFPHIHDESNSQRARRHDLESGVSSAFIDEHLRKLASGARTQPLRQQGDHVRRAHAVLEPSLPGRPLFLYVRNPIDHVASLIKQDRIWAELENSDPRQIEIIELTGHHEFGPKQVMANVGSPQTFARFAVSSTRALGAIPGAVLGLRLRFRRQAARRRS